jgi:hypothetical protein
MVACGGGGDNTHDTDNATSPVAISDKDSTENQDGQDSLFYQLEPTVSFVDGSETWPVGYESYSLAGGPYVSITENPVGPWYGQPVNFRGISSGGQQLIYRYKLKFENDVEISSVSIAGAVWGTLRLLDNDLNELKSVDISGSNILQMHTVHIYGWSDKIFYLEEYDDENTYFRYRSNIKVHFSEACASQADIIFDAANYHDISGISDGSTLGWIKEVGSIYSYFDYTPFDGIPRVWVKYAAYLTEGSWRMGLCVINHSPLTHEGTPPDTAWYPQFEILAIVTPENNENYKVAEGIITVPASHTHLNSGNFSFKVPENSDDWYTVTLYWLNDQWEGERADGLPALDANLKIARVFFDSIDDGFDIRDDDIRDDGVIDGDNRDVGVNDDDYVEDDEIIDDDPEDDDVEDNYAKDNYFGDYDIKDECIWFEGKTDLTVTDNNVTICLSDDFNHNLTIHGNNFVLIGDECENDKVKTELGGTVTINGNNALFINVKLIGEVIKNGNNIVFDNFCD